MATPYLILLWMVPLAVAMNLALRYPPLPHPVRLLGLWLDLLESRLRRLAPSLERTEGFLPDVLCSGEVRAGFIGVLLTVLLASAVAGALTALPLIGTVCAILLCWSGLALGDLLRAGREALAALEKADAERNCDSSDALAEARFLVSQLVSRDVSRADTRDLYRALAESLAENFNDAFVAPLFWLTVGGPACLWGYKAVSTMDSMWGYRTERWENFGKTAARLDDVLAYIPARLSAFLLWVVSPRGEDRQGGCWPGVAVVRRQAARMASPNAGWPMTVAAWLHGAPMGGPTVYHGVVVDKPRLGPEGSELCDMRAKQNAARRQRDVGPDNKGDNSDAAPVGPWNAERVHSLLRHLLYAGVAGGVLALLGLWLAVLAF